MGLFDAFRKKHDNSENTVPSAPKQSTDMVENAEGMLEEVNIDLSESDAIVLPIAQLGALGGGIASVLPALRTVSSTVSYTDKGLYRCVFPKGVKGYLATAHNDGLNLGTILNKKGIAGQARWIKAGPQTVNVTSIAPINPATLMMAAALISIDKKLDSIIETEKKILSFLEEDKEAKIEGDLKTLVNITREYKSNWDSDTYTSTHHQLAADIKRSAEQNMIFYQKQVADTLKENHNLFMQQLVNTTQNDLQKKFRYYRLSLYIFAYAAFLEVMLQRQFTKEYVEQIRQEILERSDAYQALHDKCFERLEKLSASSVEYYLLKGAGAAGKKVGTMIGGIPAAKKGKVDEWLIEKGSGLEKSGETIGKEALNRFLSLRDPGNGLFADNLAYVDRLFNQTQEIYIGQDNVYLVNEAM